MRKFLTLWILGVVAGSLQAQDNVQITITALDAPFNQNFQMIVTNNNATTWRINQIYVLYPTAGVLQSTLVPANWTAQSDVPWDAIPQNSLFYSTTNTPILPGGNSKTYEFKCNAPTQLNDFYILYFVTNASGSSTQNFIQRVYAEPRTDIAKDAIGTEETQVPKASAGGALGSSTLRVNYDFPVPTTRYQAEVFDHEGQRRSLVRHPPNNPTTLEPFFSGSVSRTIDATGVIQGAYWTICLKSAQWCSASLGLRDLAWVRGTVREQKPLFRWQFTPSIPDANGGRAFQFILTNPSTQNPVIIRNLFLHLRGQQNLECGPDLNTWPQRFPRDVNIPTLQLGPGQSIAIPLSLPTGVPPRRFFYGTMELFAPQDPIELPTRTFFSHEEVMQVPLVSGVSRAPSVDLERPVRVNVFNPNNGATRTFIVQASEQGRWRVELDSNIPNIPGLYQAVWQVRVKPRGALQKRFDGVLLLGNDPVDPFLRQAMILGDANGDNRIDDADLLQVLFDFGTDNPNSDIDGSGRVDDRDLLLVLFNFGEVGDE